jgi:hypothetical protein
MRRLKPAGAAALVAAALAQGPAAAQTEPVDWDAAIGRLAKEKTLAESCATLRKQIAADKDLNLALADMDYTAAKAEMDAVVATLILSISNGDEDPDPVVIEEQLRAGVEKREIFCAETRGLVDETDVKTRNLFADLVEGTAGPLLDAVTELLKMKDENDDIRRVTVSNQIADQKWRDFREIEP